MLRGVVIALALMVAACGESGSGKVSKGFEKWVGQDISSLEVYTLDGEAQPLKDVAVEGKPVVLNVWATWCPPCLKEMPTLDALGKQGHYTVVAIATDGDVQTVKDFLKKQEWGAGVRVWYDANGIVTREKLGAAAVPVTYVLDKDLKVLDVQTGAHDWFARLGTK
ncbi:MAG: TlpA family protein disulfide reductase [Blastochloris viridis]|uniref:TlpA family protein disulfide reductase n=1 Tax=Blastochloris viridis TaxID=1079 RepID=A0A6N4QYQ4_BLAVI|nr:MAG: TlpA family protein disulfide reductase [Blastochloris viridis]